MQLKLSKKSENVDGSNEPARQDIEATAATMNGKVKSQDLVGLDISGSGIAAVKVSDGRVRTASISPIDAGLMVDGEIADTDGLGAAISDFFAANGMPAKVRLGVASPRVVIRTIEVPVLTDRKEFAAAVRFQAADQLPMPLDEAVIDHQIVGTIPGADAGDAPKFQVLLVAASRGLIDGLFETSRKAGIKIQGIDLSAFGLIRVMYPGSIAANETIAYLHYGDMVNVTLAKGEVCKFTRATASGYEAMLDQLCQRVNLTREHAQMWADYVGLAAPLEALQGERDIIIATREALAGAVDQLSTDVSAAIDFHSVQDSTAHVVRILLSGPGSGIPGLADAISGRTGMTVETPAPLGALDPGSIVGSGIDERRLTLAAGLAVEQVVSL